MITKAFSQDYFKRLKWLRKWKIIFFNGCFDIMHPGHLSMINSIKEYAQYKWGKSSNYKIVCGLNSDKSVKLQNKSHPLINSENDRAIFLEHLDIDEIFIFDEEDPTALIMSLMPDVVVKGKDYYQQPFPEREFLQKTEIEIKYIDLVTEYSTTNIYNKIADNVRDEIRRTI